MTLLHEILSIALAAAPWLLLGLGAAGLVKAFIPESLLQRWLGGCGLSAVSRAAVIGAPLPLCSCGAIPTALALHRGGAGRGPATAFLIGTPGIGVDSLAISYALLGPFMTVTRAGAAVVTAIATGMLVGTTRDTPATAAAPAHGCCAGHCNGTNAQPSAAPSPGARLADGMRYAFTDVLEDIGAWLLAGLVIAGVMVTYIPPQALAAHGGGLPAMLVMSLVGIPMYICATAATPLAAGMIMAGVSPGTALVFLLAGPVTSMATLGVLRRAMGTSALVRYLTGILVSSIALGLLVDVFLAYTETDIVTQMSAAGELLPDWLEWTALAVLILAALPPVRHRLATQRLNTGM